MPVKKLNIFSYKITKETKAMIYYNSKLILVYSGKKGENFAKKIKNLSPENQQLMLAKITGNFKRGNEKFAKNTPKNQDG